MLHGDFVRSDHAHALIKSINADAALKVPGVLAVVTAKDLEPLGLHWMPTLAGDVAAVLADKKVHFQNQEIAFVVATDRYAAADGVQAVEVEYEALAPLIDPKKALDADAPIIRDDVAENDQVGQGKRHHPNHIFEWQVGDKDATDAAFASADITVKEDIAYPRCHPSPLETCGCVASMDAGERQAHDLWHVPGAARRAHGGVPDHGAGGKQHPHRVTRYRGRLRQQGRRLSGLYLRGGGVDRHRPFRSSGSKAGSTI